MSKQKKLKKIAFWMALLLLSCLVILLLGEHNWSAVQLFRRAERKNLVGPSDILEILEFEDSGFEHLLIGETEYGYTFFEWNDPYRTSGNFSYQPKGQRATLFCTEMSYNTLYTGQGFLPIFAFAENIDAVKARLCFTFDREDGVSTYDIEAERADMGYFFFRLPIDSISGHNLRLIQILITDPLYGSFPDGTATAELELFDRNGNLIETVTFSP